MTRQLCQIFLLVVLLAVPQMAEARSVRVRVLEKFHPQVIRIHDIDRGIQKVIRLNDPLPVQFPDPGNYSVEIPNSDVQRRYSGELTVERAEREDELRVINRVPLEDYVAGVVLAEIGWVPPQAMVAQGVLARTWALRNLRETESFDFGDLTSSQNYWGWNPKTPVTKELLNRYGQLVLTYNEELIEVLYHAECGAETFSAFEVWGNARVPYLPSRVLPTEARQPRQARKWQRKVSIAELRQVFELGQVPELQRIDEDDRIVILLGDRRIGIDAFRLAVNRKLGWNQLLSNRFRVQELESSYRFTGTGFGHLAGMCQQAAQNLAQNGWSYEEILELFFPETVTVDLGRLEDELMGKP